MARFRTLVGLGLASTMMITAPVFASTSTAAKPVAQGMAKPAAAPKAVKAATSKRAAPARHHAHQAKAASHKGKKAAR